MRGIPFALAATLLAVLDIGVPFLLLRHGAPLFAPLLYWCFLPLGVIALAAVYTAGWRDRP
jgi:hypothetical protein